MHYLILKYIINVLYILSIFVICVQCFDQRRYKYKKTVIEDPRTCSVVDIRKIELKKNAEESVIVSQSASALHGADWAKHFRCTFAVKSEFGLFAVIQNINFRRNLTTGECIDYVKFVTRQPSNNVTLCGKFNVFDSPELNLFNTQDSYGYIETTVFISRQKWNETTEMDLKIVYTLFKGCDNDHSPCNNPKQCINNIFNNDSVANCPEFCHDEGHCQLKPRIASGSSSTKIILSAVTSMVVAFLVFFVCIWVCRKTGKLCFHVNESPSSIPNQASRTIEMQTRSQDRETTTTPQPEVSVPEPEKDLPPSYDSLFPER